MIISDSCQPGAWRNKESWLPKCGWPEDCYVQWGGKGLVLQENPYTTAFFEAFPRNPDAFVRGEGATIEYAERNCFDKWTRILNCKSHEFERRQYRNGLGWCKHCNLSSMVFEPLEVCCKCGAKTFYRLDENKQWWCEKCAPPVPEKEEKEYTKEEFAVALKEVIEHMSRTKE